MGAAAPMQSSTGSLQCRSAVRGSPGGAPPDLNEAQHEERSRWRDVVRGYQHASTGRACWQLLNTLVPYALCWVAIAWVREVSLWAVLPFAVLAGVLSVRIFIFMHDCGHGSYFRSRRACDVVGWLAGVLTFTPYAHWRWQHGVHHGTSGRLDRRGTGDLWTLTVQEYLDASPWRKICYRLARNPLVLFVLAPLFVFFVLQRLPAADAGPRERQSVWWTNLALLCVAVLMSRWLGCGTYALVQGVAWMVAGSAGLWLFYVQHQFEDTYWERGGSWDPFAAAMQGSSFYRLPRILQWFSGNIGFHHIHHLNPRVPNYRLQACHESDPLFLRIKPLTLLASLRTLSLRLWDEAAGKLVGYARMRQVRAQQRAENWSGAKLRH